MSGILYFHIRLQNVVCKAFSEADKYKPNYVKGFWLLFIILQFWNSFRTS